MTASKSTSQKERDLDLLLLTSCVSPGDLGSERGYKWLTPLPGFIEWIEYGVGVALSFHAIKIDIYDWYKNRYEGIITATCFVNQKIGGEKISQARFHLFDDMRKVRIELEFFPPYGTQESIDPILDALHRNHWEQVEEQPA